MGLFDYECKPCRKTVEIPHGMMESRHDRRCPRCNTVMRPLISIQANISPFRPYEEWNLEPNAPVTIHSAGQLDRECEKRGLNVGKGGSLSRLDQRQLEAYHRNVARQIERKKP